MVGRNRDDRHRENHDAGSRLPRVVERIGARSRRVAGCLRLVGDEAAHHARGGAAGSCQESVVRYLPRQRRARRLLPGSALHGCEVARGSRAQEILSGDPVTGRMLALGAALAIAATVSCAAPAADDHQQTSAAAPVPRELPAVVARVNDETIERWEVEAAVREITLANLHPLPQAERDELMR